MKYSYLFTFKDIFSILNLSRYKKYILRILLLDFGSCQDSCRKYNYFYEDLKLSFSFSINDDFSGFIQTTLSTDQFLISHVNLSGCLCFICS